MTSRCDVTARTAGGTEPKRVQWFPSVRRWCAARTSQRDVPLVDDIALRCHRPYSGRNRTKTGAQWFPSVRRWYAARTSQRDVPTETCAFCKDRVLPTIIQLSLGPQRKAHCCNDSDAAIDCLTITTHETSHLHLLWVTNDALQEDSVSKSQHLRALFPALGRCRRGRTC